MDFVNSNIKIFTLLFIATFIIMIILVMIGNYYDPIITDQASREKIGYAMKIIFFTLTVFMAIFAMPLIPYLVTTFFLKLNSSINSGWVELVQKNQFSIIKYFIFRK